jgi:RecT family
MNEEIMEDQTIAEPVPTRPTRRDLVERGPEVLDPRSLKEVGVSVMAGGLMFKDIEQVMTFAKGMSTAGHFLQKEFRGNVGACLAITMQAIRWRMEPFQVASKAYVVNDRVGWESQLVHAVINSCAPLQHRVDCQYEGEGQNRSCTIRGMFTNGDIREYTSPPLATIKRKSPLWETDPDQQLFYYALRAWARKWVPEVLLGVYTREELTENPNIGREEESVPTPGLAARLTAGERGEEGFRDGHADRELDQIAPAGQIIDHEPSKTATTKGGQVASAVEADGGHGHGRKRNKRTTDVPTANADTQHADTARTKTLVRDADMPSKDEVKRVADRAEKKPDAAKAEPLPKTVKEYTAYAKAWILKETDADRLRRRWADERALRNNIGMTSEEREPLDEAIIKRRQKLE